MEAIEQLFEGVGITLLLLGLEEPEKQELLAFARHLFKQRKWEIVTTEKKPPMIIGLT